MTTKTAVFNNIKTINVDKLGYIHQYNFTDRVGREWEVESNPSSKELYFFRKGKYDSKVVVKGMSNKKDIAARISNFINKL